MRGRIGRRGDRAPGPLVASTTACLSPQTACWRRFFWRWALSPLRFEPFSKFVARSTMMLHGRCIPRHEYSTRQVRDIHTYNRQRRLSKGQATVWGTVSMFQTLLLRRSRCERSQSHDLQFTKEENRLQ